MEKKPSSYEVIFKCFKTLLSEKHYIKVVSTLVIICFFYWVKKSVDIRDRNKCDMTYMYEVPNFIEIRFKNASSSSYKLYAYGEGMYTKKLKNGFYDGIPVLFIPGNMGSYKQVRSLASVAYRKFVDTQGPFEFNFFTIDFKEEFSALHGQLLFQQTNFVTHCIKEILSLYKNTHKYNPKSVILIGHSVGGMIARGVFERFSQYYLDFKAVSVVLTLATPHNSPAILLDRHVLQFYRKTNKFWHEYKNSTLKDVIFITIGGGSNDILVSNSLTTSKYADLDLSLQSIKNCWLTTDHRAIVWCKQLVLNIVRALFNSVDKEKYQISESKPDILQAFKNNLLENKKDDLLNEKEFLTMSKSNLGVVSKLKQNFKLKQSHRKQLILVPTKLHQTDEIPLKLNILQIGLHSFSSAFYCDVDSKNNITSSETAFKFFPNPISKDKKLLSLILNSKFSHVAYFTEFYQNQRIFIEYHKNASQILSAPSFFNSKIYLTKVIESLRNSDSNKQHAAVDGEGDLTKIKSFNPIDHFANFKLSGFSESWQVFSILFKPLNSQCSVILKPVVRIKPTWSKYWENVQDIETSDGSFFYILELSTSAVTSLWKNREEYKVDSEDSLRSENYVEVGIIVSPGCKGNFTIETDYARTFYRFILFSATKIPGYLALYLILILALRYVEPSKDSAFISGLKKLVELVNNSQTRLTASANTTAFLDKVYTMQNTLNYEWKYFLIFGFILKESMGWGLYYLWVNDAGLSLSIQYLIMASLVFTFTLFFTELLFSLFSLTLHFISGKEWYILQKLEVCKCEKNFFNKFFNSYVAIVLTSLLISSLISFYLALLFYFNLVLYFHFVEKPCHKNCNSDETKARKDKIENMTNDMKFKLSWFLEFHKSFLFLLLILGILGIPEFLYFLFGWYESFISFDFRTLFSIRSLLYSIFSIVYYFFPIDFMSGAFYFSLTLLIIVFTFITWFDYRMITAYVSDVLIDRKYQVEVSFSIHIIAYASLMLIGDKIFLIHYFVLGITLIVLAQKVYLYYCMTIKVLDLKRNFSTGKNNLGGFFAMLFNRDQNPINR